MTEIFDFSLKRDKLYKQIADQIQELILDDSIHAGDKLPGERELAEQMGVSRTVIREAIRVLSDRGLVRVKSGCGTYVRELSVKDAAASIELFLKLKQSPQSFQNVSEVRSMIEVEAAGLAAERATAQDIAKIQEAIKGMHSAGNESKRYAEYDVAFHTAIAQATHNDLISVLLGPISDLLAEMVRVSLNAPNAVDEGLAHHRHILQHIQDHNREAAQEAMRAHIEHAHALVTSVQNRAELEGE